MKDYVGFRVYAVDVVTKKIFTKALYFGRRGVMEETLFHLEPPKCCKYWDFEDMSSRKL